MQACVERKRGQGRTRDVPNFLLEDGAEPSGWEAHHVRCHWSRCRCVFVGYRLTKSPKRSPVLDVRRRWTLRWRFFSNRHLFVIFRLHTHQPVSNDLSIDATHMRTVRTVCMYVSMYVGFSLSPKTTLNFLDYLTNLNNSREFLKFFNQVKNYLVIF